MADIRKHQALLSKLLTIVVNQTSPKTKEALTEQINAKITNIASEMDLTREGRYILYFKHAIQCLKLDDKVMVPDITQALCDHDLLVMEFIQGQSISELMQSDKASARTMILNMLDNWLLIACSTGLVHGDMHPANGLFSNGNLHLLDFGDAFLLPWELQYFRNETQFSQLLLLIFKYRFSEAFIDRIAIQLKDIIGALFSAPGQQNLTPETVARIKDFILGRLMHKKQTFSWDKWSEEIPIRAECSWPTLFKDVMKKYHLSLKAPMVTLHKCLSNLINCFDAVKNDDEPGLLEARHPELSTTTNNLLQLFSLIDQKPADPDTRQ